MFGMYCMLMMEYFCLDMIIPEGGEEQMAMIYVIAFIQAGLQLGGASPKFFRDLIWNQRITWLR